MPDSKKPLILDQSGFPLSEAQEQQAEAGFELGADFNLRSLTSRVKVRIPGTDKAVWMLPAEARLLGLRFIAMAQEALDMAVFIRFGVEAGSMEPPEAAQAWQVYSLAVRQAHAKQYAEALKQTEQAEAMAQGAANRQGKPS